MSFGCDIAEIELFDRRRLRVEGLRVGLFLVHERAEIDQEQRDQRGGWRATRAWKVTHIPTGCAIDFTELRTALQIADEVMRRYPVSEHPTSRPLPDDGMEWLRRCVIADAVVSRKADRELF